MIPKLFYWIVLSSILFALGSVLEIYDKVRILDCPYHVALERQGINWCSGAIIAIDKVVTAAHCVTSGRVVVRYGTDKVLTGGTVVNVAHVKIHPDYNNYTYDYDVAVLTLDEDLRFSARCAPIPLSKNILSGKRICYVSGWKKKESGEKLLELYFEVAKEISLTECQTLWNMKLTSRMICFSKEGKTCYGDSGGPLINLESYSLIGIVSWGTSHCSDPRPPIVYTKIGVLYNWIYYQIYIKRRMERSCASKIKLFCNPFH